MRAGSPAARLPNGRRRCHAPMHFRPPRRAGMGGPERVVYFPSCAARNMGAQRGDDNAERCRSSPSGCSARPGLMSSIPQHLAALCCGQPFESKGLYRGRRPQVRRTGSGAARGQRERPLADRLRHQPLRLPDEAVLSQRGCRCTTASSSSTTCVLPRLALVPLPRRSRSTRCAASARWARWKADGDRERCSAEVVTVPDVLCCGFAGDKGFNRPELNEYALRHLKEALPAGCSARLFVEPHLRNRLVRAGGLSLPLDHPSRRGVRIRTKVTFV